MFNADHFNALLWVLNTVYNVKVFHLQCCPLKVDRIHISVS